MPNQTEIFQEIQKEEAVNKGNGLFKVRQKYIQQLHGITGRNTIAYYSAFLSFPKQSVDLSINDQDKNAFMTTVHKMDRTKGLDLILHTPGGDIAATESIVDYLRGLFGNDIRAIVPQIAMSAGTMISLSCKEVILGKQSSLGPIDPQIGGVACKAVIEEFNKAYEDIKRDPAYVPLWQKIIENYHPTFLNACQNAIDWSGELVEEWLTTNMCNGDKKLAENIVHSFSDLTLTRSHSRHISAAKCKEIGVKVIDMEDHDELQDSILSLHHAYMHLLNTGVVKIVENQAGAVYGKTAAIQPAAH